MESARAPFAVLRRAGVVKVVRDVQLAMLRYESRVRARALPRSTDLEAPLRIVACTPTYLPTHRRGAEITLHAVLTRLQARGHAVEVLVTDGESARVDGVAIHAGASRSERLRRCHDADIVVGQLSARWDALAAAARTGRPMVYFMHIGNVSRHQLYGRPTLTVFNSELLRDAYPWIRPALVVHPPIEREAYLAHPGDAVTLVNLTEPKGAPLFYDLATHLTDHRFLGVKGPGEQVIPDSLPPNVTLLDPVTDMREVYGQTRILLVPSVYESYGRVALEAAASGIPTIAHPTVGLREAMGAAALWVDRDDTEAWRHAIEHLDDPREWDRRSAEARAQFDHLDPDSEIDALERALLQLRRAGSA